MRLEERSGAITLVTCDLPRQDFTGAVQVVVEQTLPHLEQLDGYVLKSRSPSCAWRSASIFSADGSVLALGSGFFVAQVIQACPALPLIEEDALEDGGARDRFLVAMCARRRWRVAMGSGVKPGVLSRFHQREILLLRAFGKQRQASLRKIAAAEAEGDGQHYTYADEFFRTLCVQLSAKQHTVVLRLALRVMRGSLSRNAYCTLADHVTRFETGAADLKQVLAKFRECVKEHAITPLADQSYLVWDSTEWALRFGI